MGVKILFACVYSSPPPSPSAGNESHLLALIWESKEREPQGTQGFTEAERKRFFPVFPCAPLCPLWLRIWGFSRVN